MSEAIEGAAPERIQALWVRFRNFKCIREAKLDLDTGAIHIIKGDTGQGKTAILQGIEAVCRGVDESMIRNGEDSAELELELSTAHVKRILRRDEDDVLMVTDANGKQVKRPKDFLRTICGESAFDPIAWVKLSGGPDKGKTERTRTQRDQLLGGISIRLRPEEVVDAVRGLGEDHIRALKEVNLDDVDFDQHGFVVCDSIKKACEAARLKHNAAAEQAEATLSITPAPDRAAPSASAQALKEAYDRALRELHHAEAQRTGKTRLEERKERLKAEIEREAQDLPGREQVKKTRTKWETALDEAKTDVERLTRELEKAQERLTEATGNIGRVVQLERRLDAQEARENDLAELEGELTRGEGAGYDMDGLKQAVERAKVDWETRAQQDRHDAAAKAAETARGRWDLFQNLVKLFRDAIPKALIERAALPIDGLSVDENQILIHGVPLHQLGTSEQMRVGVLVAAALNPRCGFLPVDGVESMGTQDRVALAKAAKEMGLTLIMTEVDPEAEPEPGVTVMRHGEAFVAA